MLLETKNRTSKCLKRHYSAVQSMKKIAVLTEDGAFALFFVPTPGDLTAQESPPTRICHPRQKKAENGGQPGREVGGGGGWLGAAGIDVFLFTPGL